MGRNHPAEAMPFDGMVRRYFDNLYIINLFTNKRVLMEQVNRLYARCCTQHLMHTPTFPPLAPTPHRHVFEKEFERAHSFSQRSVSSKLLLNKNCMSSSFVQFPFLRSLMTPVS